MASGDVACLGERTLALKEAALGGVAPAALPLGNPVTRAVLGELGFRLDFRGVPGLEPGKPCGSAPAAARPLPPELPRAPCCCSLMVVHTRSLGFRAATLLRFRCRAQAAEMQTQELETPCDPCS